MIGKIQRVDLREVWKHEARDFTQWLEANLDVLNERLELSLASVEREQKAGDFNVDLVAEDSDGNKVIIENQLGKSNHDHLGKILTYLTSLDAKTAIWIVSEARPEHIKAISWLNESGSACFYLFTVEAIKIGNSPPAPLLTRIVGPTEEARAVGEEKKEWAEREELRYRFFSQLLQKEKTLTKLHANISPTQHNWVGTVVNQLGFSYLIRQHDSQVELYIDRDRDTGEGNKAIFDRLFAQRKQIEREFGEPLIWERLDQKRACKIRKNLEGGYRDDQIHWPKIHDAMIDAMIRLEKALRPHLEKLKP